MAAPDNANQQNANKDKNKDNKFIPGQKKDSGTCGSCGPDEKTRKQDSHKH